MNIWLKEIRKPLLLISYGIVMIPHIFQYDDDQDTKELSLVLCGCKMYVSLS
jgi:hypothetical protein